MPRGAARSRSYLYEHFPKMFADAGEDLSLVTDIYARASLANDERYRATGGQVDDLIDLVLEAGRIPGMIHVDDSLSAWKKDVWRQAFENMIGRLEQGKTGGLALWNPSRFSRRPKDGERIIEAVENNRALVIMDPEGKRNLNTAKGRKDWRDELTAAAYYSDQLSDNVKRGKRKKVRSGEWNVSVRPFGFNTDMTQVPVEADWIRTLTKRLLAGESQDALIADLNKACVATTRGKPWCRSSLRAMLQRGINAGVIEHKESGTTSKMPGSPIITEATLLEVRRKYASRKRGRPSTHLCSPWTYCYCGAKMYGKTVDKTRALYHCNVSWGGCGSTIDGKKTDELIRAFVIERMSDKRHVDAIAADEDQVQDELRDLRAKLAEDEKTERGLGDRLKKKQIPYDRWESLTEDLYPEIERLRAEIEALVHAAPPAVDRQASRGEWARLWDTAAAVDDRRNLITSALGDKVIIIGRSVERHLFEADRVSIGRKPRPTTQMTQ